MATNHTATLSLLLASSTIEDHDEILKAACAVLKSSKSDQEALHTRVVALLKLDRFEDALRALDDGGDKLAQRCVLEKAYALYKTGKLDEAKHLISETKNTLSRGLRHLYAQVAYRAENFEDAAKIYKELSAQDPVIDGETNDLRINSAAVDVQLEWQGNGELVEKSRKKPTREDLEAFETVYNAACGYIARGDLETGSVLLTRAKALCEALDELSEDEKRAEILPILVQQTFVLTKLGKLDEAKNLQESIVIEDIPELPTRVVAQSNAISATAPTHNPYLTQRYFETLPALSKMEKLFEHQADILRRNRYTIDLKTLKYEGVLKSTSAILSQHASPNISPSISSLSAINVAAYAHCGSSKASLKEMLLLLEQRPTDVGLILTILQLYILSNNAGSAIALLESFFRRLEESGSEVNLNARFAPGLTALAVSLYSLQRRKSAIRAELGKAASYWRRKSNPPEALLNAAGIELLGSTNTEDLKTAAEIFNSLQRQDPNSRIATAGLVASKATIDISAVESVLEKLTPIYHLISDEDAAALESGGLASLPVIMTETSKKRPAPLEREQTKKKPRKSLLPKDYEEGKKVDPERWLPLKDRSSYRPKGKKGKKKAMDSTQGGIVREEESLELVGGLGAVKVEKASGGSGKAGKKKKGKK